MRLSVVLLALAGVVPAQQPQTGAITGRVVNGLTNEPIRRAAVTIRTSSEVYTAATDPGGNFRIDGVSPGSYVALAARTGFVYANRDERGNAIRVVVKPSEETRDVVISLIPASVILGRVVDEENEPVERAMVQLFRYGYDGGRLQLLPVGSATTNDIGEYRIGNIIPGKYFLSATSSSLFVPGVLKLATMWDGSAQQRPAFDYPPVFYPGVTDPSAATRIQISAGMELRGVDLRLQKFRVFGVRGRVRGGGNAAGASAVKVSVQPAGRSSTSRTGGTIIMDADARFEVTGLRPGSYLLVARQGQRESSLSAQVRVEVSGAEVNGVVLTLQPNPSVAGRVVFEGPPPTEPSKTTVQLWPDDPVAGTAVYGEVQADGSFRTLETEPGRYSLGVYSVPAGFYLKSARRGDQDVLGSGIELGHAEADELRIVLAPGAGTIAGSVRNERDEPVAGASVVLISGSQARLVNRTTETGYDGEFKVESVAPGSYKLYAFEALDGGADRDPEFMGAFAEQAKAVKVSENGRERVQLKVIPASMTEDR